MLVAVVVFFAAHLSAYQSAAWAARWRERVEQVRAFEAASGKIIPYQVAPRRPGDIAECWADPTTAETELGWRAERDLACMMRDSWRWQSQNPNGYQGAHD